MLIAISRLIGTMAAPPRDHDDVFITSSESSSSGTKPQPPHVGH
jgi:hypothetical protein